MRLLHYIFIYGTQKQTFRRQFLYFVYFLSAITNNIAVVLKNCLDLVIITYLTMML
jgi:hypothetical protein